LRQLVFHAGELLGGEGGEVDCGGFSWVGDGKGGGGEGTCLWLLGLGGLGGGGRHEVVLVLVWWMIVGRGMGLGVVGYAPVGWD